MIYIGLSELIRLEVQATLDDVRAKLLSDLAKREYDGWNKDDQAIAESEARRKQADRAADHEDASADSAESGEK